MDELTIKATKEQAENIVHDFEGLELSEIAWEINKEEAECIKIALEKQIPKKIIKYDKCPVCNYEQSTTWYYVGSSYCEFCGQRLDWNKSTNKNLDKERENGEINTDK